MRDVGATGRLYSRRRSLARRLLALIPLALGVAACGGRLEVGFAPDTPTPDGSAAATVAALQMENARLSTQVAALAAASPREGAPPALPSLSPTPGILLTPPVSPTAEPTAVAPPATSTYVNTEAGFAFDYAPDWRVSDAGAAVYLTSFREEGGAGAEGVPVGESKIDFVLGGPGREQGLEAMVAQVRVQVASEGGGILWEQRQELTGGVPAVQLRVLGPFGETAVLCTVINGRGIRVVGHGDLSRFDEIVRTLRPYP